MSLIPESISSNNTESWYKTLEYRLQKLNINQLIIRIENETDNNRLQLWLDMFGIELSGIDFLSFTEIEKRNFIKRYISILQSSGTKKSIIELCMAIGATQARIVNSWQLFYNGESRYEGLHKHDAGKQYQGFAIDVYVKGVADLNLFKTRFNNLFKRTQPARIYVKNIIQE